MYENDAPNIPMPLHHAPSLRQFDENAIAARDAVGCRLAAFTAVFDPSLCRVLMVRLGDYARRDLGGNPWSLPGGAVEVDESPSAAAIREIQEETNLRIDAAALHPCAWIRRPYVVHEDGRGELLLLFAGRLVLPGNPRANPPETLDVALVDYDLEAWLETPSVGEGDAPLQPLRRHWVYWSALSHEHLRKRDGSLKVCTYRSAAEMAMPVKEDSAATDC